MKHHKFFSSSYNSADSLLLDFLEETSSCNDSLQEIDHELNQKVSSLRQTEEFLKLQ